MSHHKLEVKNLTFEYDDGFVAVNNISFLITHGQSFGIIGANGAGKSTLLMLLMGVLMPQSGTVVVGDTVLTKKTLPNIRQRLGFVFQNSDDQLFMTTVFDDVAFGPRNFGLNEQEVELRVEQALEKVGISHLKNKAPFKLSGGEKRSVAIASVLSMQPDVLIMDEPTDGLDPKARRRVIHLLQGFAHTKIITSHDLDLILSVCEKTIVLKNGEIKAVGNTNDIVTNKELMDECGLEIPLSMQGCPVCVKK